MRRRNHRLTHKVVFLGPKRTLHAAVRDARRTLHKPKNFCHYTSASKVYEQVRSETSSLSAGVPELMILRLLQDQEMYGYEIVQAIALRTGQAVTPGEGVVYPVLHGLEKDGALKSRRRTVNGRSRVYYTLTAKGAKRLNHLVTNWNTLNTAVQAMMAGRAHAV